MDLKTNLAFSDGGKISIYLRKNFSFYINLTNTPSKVKPASKINKRKLCKLKFTLLKSKFLTVWVK